MSETYIVTAKTIDEAIAIANKEYADAEHEISYDILEMPKKGFLGIGAKDAKIKVTVNEIRDADLESIVSDLRSMKLHTDREGRQNEAKKPRQSQNQQNQAAGRTTENKPTPKQNQQKATDNKPVSKSAEKQMSKPAEKQTTKSVEKQTSKPAEKQMSKPAEKQTPKPVEKQMSKPAEKPASKSAEKQTPKPAPETPAKKSETDNSEDRKPEVKMNVAPADVMPKEHTEVIVSAPIGLYDLPAKKAEPAPVLVSEKREEKPEAVSAETEPDGIEEFVASGEEENETVEDMRGGNVKIAVSEEEMKYALDFANTLLRNMQIDARAERGVCPEGETYETMEDADVYPKIEIVGSGTGILIGHHGETLDAIQYLVNLSAIRNSRKANGHGDYVKIVVDVENYRTKREETLRALARRMAARAVKTKKNVFLEPMNAYERRIIHSELQTYENVSTHSVGTDKNRKIIITYEGPDKQVPGARKKSNKPKTESGKSSSATQSGSVTRSGSATQSGSAAGGGGERPRPRKPQKMPIEKLPDFLAASSTEPDEVLSIED